MRRERANPRLTISNYEVTISLISARRPSTMRGISHDDYGIKNMDSL